MLVPFRHPVGIAVSALALLSFLGFVLASVYVRSAGAAGAGGMRATRRRSWPTGSSS